jgi:hypothetical protein
MPVMYGEGKTNAVRRLRKEIDDASKNKEYLRHLYVTDPRADKIRIEETKVPQGIGTKSRIQISPPHHPI